jgi:hypothetical protein
MSYAYEYTEGLKQFGMIHLVMKFTDSDNILPEMNIPMVLNDFEYSTENLAKIADQIIYSNTPKSTPLEVEAITETTLNVTLSTEQQAITETTLNQTLSTEQITSSSESELNVNNNLDIE